MLFLKRMLIGAAIGLVVLVVVNLELFKYGISQLKGQMAILYQARPIDEILKDPYFPDSLKAKIHLIQEVRQFAVEELDLMDSKNYTTIYDQQGRDVLWNVSACEPYKLKPHKWSFPVLGSFSYKGFFDLEKAKLERGVLDSLGLDTNIRPVGAWSTLGWFQDPILSNMLYRKEGDLAELIIHELTHATIFVKDSLTFNENLASFIGTEGAKLFLERKYGGSSPELQAYINAEVDYEKYIEHMIRGSQALDSTYRSITLLPDVEKKIIKERTIKSITSSLDTISFHNPQRFQKTFKSTLPNNARFMSYLRYRSQQGLLSDVYLNNFAGNIKAYILHLKSEYGT